MPANFRLVSRSSRQGLVSCPNSWTSPKASTHTFTHSFLPESSGIEAVRGNTSMLDGQLKLIMVVVPKADGTLTVIAGYSSLVNPLGWLPCMLCLAVV